MARDEDFGIVIGGGGNGQEDIGTRQRRVQQRFEDRNPGQKAPGLGSMPHDGTLEDAKDLGWTPDYYQQWLAKDKSRGPQSKASKGGKDLGPGRERNYRQVRQFPEIPEPGMGTRPDVRGHSRATSRRTTRGIK